MKPQSPRRIAVLVMLASFVPVRPAGPAPQAGAKPQTDLDAFMARVLDRRDENWKKLHDYILSETERLVVAGPGGETLLGRQREFTWYVREGYLVRSPVRYNGVGIPDAERREFEQRWLDEEKQRETKRRDRDAKERPTATEKQEADAAAGAASLDAFVDQRGEPRFVSEAYFLKFKFEPGNYYLAGRERFEGREVVRIEYYPTRLFRDEDEGTEARDAKKGEAPKPATKKERERQEEREKEKALEDRIQRNFNKVSRVTLWIDPAEHQIVKYTFENVDFGFLPGRWIVRVDEVSASMTMGRYFEDVWLPRQIAIRAGLTLAKGSYRFDYGRDFHDYRKGEVSARIRSIGGPVK